MSQESDTNNRSSNQSLCCSSLSNDVFRNDYRYVKIAKTQKSPDSTLKADGPALPPDSCKETKRKKLKKEPPKDRDMPTKSNEGYSSSGTVLYEDSLDCVVTLSPLEFDCSADQRDRSGLSDTRNVLGEVREEKDLTFVSLEDLSDEGMSVSDIDRFSDEDKQVDSEELTFNSSGNDTSTQQYQVPDIGRHQRQSVTPLCIVKLYKSQVFQKHNIYC